uniref:Ninjurin 2 n=1 Tax=Paramormyrops kingsleyae TaxID=1676925 RepID=A0A3B3RLL4_9TELE
LVSHINRMFAICLMHSDSRGGPEPFPEATGQQAGPLNMNHYANKKSAAESMLDVALLMANASQLKTVMEEGSDFTFYYALIGLISISLALQILVGILLIFIGETKSNQIRKPLIPHHYHANILSSFTI